MIPIDETGTVDIKSVRTTHIIVGVRLPHLCPCYNTISILVSRVPQFNTIKLEKLGLMLIAYVIILIKSRVFSKTKSSSPLSNPK